MRILHVDTGPEMRGGQYQVLLLLKCLRERGHESILLAREKSALWNAASISGFAVEPAEVKELWRRSKDVMLVHAHDARAHTIAAMASRRKFVVSRRVAFPIGRSVASHWKYQRAARYLAVSEFVATELMAAGVRQEKIDVVYDGVELPAHAVDWSRTRPAVALDSTDPLKERSTIEEASRLAGIPVAFSTDLVNDLLRASMFVYLSATEGLGSAALVAMSMGVPVIASAVAGLTEAIAPEVSGLLVANDPPKVAEAMRRIIDEPGLGERLGAAGRERVSDLFTAGHLVERTVESYERALGS